MESEEIKKVSELIENKKSEELKEFLQELHPADIAELCDELDAEEARSIYLLLDNEKAAVKPLQRIASMHPSTPQNESS